MLLHPGRTLDRERASSPDRGQAVSLPWHSETYWNGRNSFRLAPHVAATLEPTARVRSGRVSVAPVWLFTALGRTGGLIVAFTRRPDDEVTPPPSFLMISETRRFFCRPSGSSLPSGSHWARPAGARRSPRSETRLTSDLRGWRAREPPPRRGALRVSDCRHRRPCYRNDLRPGPGLGSFVG
jgi:hypothetical protein